MKIKYLKKLRKRYSCKWVVDQFDPYSSTWVILDHKEKDVLKCKSAYDFIISTLDNYNEVNWRYHKRKIKRDRAKEYRKYLKQDKK